MWRRVLLVLVGYSVMTVVVLSIPLALAVSRERTQRFDEGRLAAASYFADLAARDGDAGDLELREAVTRYQELYGEGVVVIDGNGQPRASAGLDSRSDSVQDAASAALRNQRSEGPPALAPWSDSSALIAVPVGAGTQVEGAVVMRASTAEAKRDVTTSWTLTAAGAVALLGFASLIAVGLSRWTVRPLTRLATRVRSLNEAVLDRLPVASPVIGADTPPGNRGRPSVSTAGPPEVRQLTIAFEAMADDVESAAAAQRRLIADSAHALRNPLAALQIRIDTLGFNLTGESLIAQRKTAAEVQRLGSIVDDLLALASAEAPLEVDSTPNSCDVDSAVTRRYEFWSDALTDAGMDGVAVIEARGTNAAISEVALYQVLDVVLSNAVKYAGPGARVEIGCRTVGDEIIIWVADSGHGVAEDELQRITDRFYRASTAEGQGTGLGLSIAKALTEQAGGVMLISAARPSGLEVEVRLPCRSSSEQTRPH